MTIPTFKKLVSLVLVALVLGILTQPTFGASGIWTADSDGNWSDPTKWSGGTVADAVGSSADFSTVDITGNRTVTLDTARTISSLIFGDAGITPNFGWTLTGPNALTLGAVPSINVSNQTTTLSVPVAGTAGLTKVGSGTLIFLGTNTYSGTTLVSNGVVNFNGASASTSGGIFNVGGAAGRAVVNLNTTGSVTHNGGSYGVGGLQGDTTDVGVGVINISAGTLNNGANNNYTEIGTGSINGNTLSGVVSYGCINLLPGGTLNTLGNSGIRVGAGGIGIFNQTGGTLNCSRWFAVGSQPNGAGNANAGGIGVVNFLGGTATIASGYRILINDKNGGVGIVNVGSAAGGAATVTSLSGTGLDFMDQGGTTGKGMLNLNNGTLRLAGPMYRNNSSGVMQVNWNGATLQLNANANLVTTGNGFPGVNIYKRGAVIDTQGNTITSAAQFLNPGGNGIYPAGGTLAISSGGGSGYLGTPLVTISGGSGADALAIANISGGVVTGVTMTCPGHDYLAGDALSFTFTGGGPTTPAGVFGYTLQAADLSANAAGGLTKFGSGKLALTAASTYAGGTSVAAGTLDVTVDGGLGSGNVNVSSGATLILENGASSAYISPTANLVVSPGALVNLNFSGTDTINGLSLNGGATYVAPGTYGSSTSGAANVDDTHFTGAGILSVSTTPVVNLTVVLTSSANPSIFGQSVDFKATVVSTGGGTPTGSVTFKDGTTELGTLTLNGSGAATLTTSALTVGSHPVTATYNSTVSQILVQEVKTPTDVWTGSINNVWDVNSTANWTVLGSAAAFQQGNYVQLDDSATGSPAIILNVTASPLGIVVSNSTKSYVISGSGGIAGATGLSKFGPGSLVLNVTNTYTGSTVVSNGSLTFGPGSASLGNGSFNAGGSAGRAAVNVNTLNSLVFQDPMTLGGNVGSTTDTGSGVVNQTSGTFTYSGGGNQYFELGAGGADAYGAYNLAGGTLTAAVNYGIRVGATGTGVFVQSGGTLNCGRYFAIGTQSGVNNVGGYGVATFTGGTATFASAQRIIVGDKPGSTGIFNLGTLAGGTAVLTNLFNNSGFGGLELIDNAGAVSGTINLNRGTIQLGGAIYRPATSAGTPALNLNGATLQAGANNISLLTNVNNFISGDFVGNLFSRGLVVDSLTNYCSIDADLLSTAGNGAYPAAGLLAVTDGGAGYLGTPLVTVSGGSGSGAMAVANVANGLVTSVALTCAGQNYQPGDVLNFDFSKGSPTTPAGTFTYTLQAGDLLDNAKGGLTKIGSGQLALNGLNNNYTGATVVSNGTLVVAGNLVGGGAVEVRGGILGGTGSINGPVTVAGGGTLTAGIGSIGTLNVPNAVTFLPGAAFRAVINKEAGTQNLVQGVSTLTYAGTLLVTNQAGSFAVGDSFKLFDAATYAGAFTAVVPATPGSGMAWDLSQLATSGTLAIVVGSTINPNPTNIVASVTNNVMYLSWPADHTGWVLQVQTNALSVGLANNWVTVPGSETSNQVSLPIVPANQAVFYRLALPTP